MLATYGFVVFAAIICSANSEDFLAKYITPCSFKEKDVNSCVKKQMQTALPAFALGIPELGVPSTDPVKLDDIIIDGNGLKLVFTEAAMHGLSTAKITDLQISLGKVDQAFKLEFVANLKLIAKYEADGKILILPIQGQGDSIINAHNVKVTIDSKMTEVKESDGAHFKLVTPTYKYTIEKTTFALENLFNGNKELSEATHKFANENSEQLMDELGPNAIKQIVKTIVKVINKFFSKVTISQIVNDYDSRP